MNKTAITAAAALAVGLLASTAPDAKTMTQGLLWMHDDNTAIIHDENGVVFLSWDELNEKPIKRGILQVNPDDGMALVFYDENGENPLVFNRNALFNLVAMVVENKAKLELPDRAKTTSNTKPLNDA